MTANGDHSEAHAIAIAWNTVRRVQWSDRPSCGWDDLASVALIAAVLAHRTYDPARGKFTTHVVGRVRSAVADMMRMHQPLSRRWHKVEREGGEVPAHRLPPFSLEEIVFQFEDYEPVTLGDTLVTRGEIEAEALARTWAEPIWRAMAELPECEAYVLWRYCHDGATCREIAREIGRSESRAFQLREQGLATLRRQFAGEE